MSRLFNNKIAQMCIIGINNKEDIEPVKRLIKKYAIGGVFIYKKAYDDYNEMRNLIKSLKLCNKDNKYPLFIVTNQECNDKTIMPSRFSKIGNINKIVLTQNKEYAHKSGMYVGNILNKTGININISSLVNKDKLLYEYELEYINGVNENILAVPKCNLNNIDNSFDLIMGRFSLLKKISKKESLVMTNDINKDYKKYILGKKNLIKLAFLNNYDLIVCGYYPGIAKDMIIRPSKFMDKSKIDSSFKKIINLKEKNHINDKPIFKGVYINIINYKIDELNKEINDSLR